MILIFISILNHTQTGTHFSTLKTLWIKYLEQNASFIPLSREEPTVPVPSIGRICQQFVQNTCIVTNGQSKLSKIFSL